MPPSLPREVFDEHGVSVPDTTLPERGLEELEAQGRALRQELQGTSGQSGYAVSSTHLAADLFQLALQLPPSEAASRNCGAFCRRRARWDSAHRKSSKSSCRRRPIAASPEPPTP